MPPTRVTADRSSVPSHALALLCAGLALSAWSCLVPRATGPGEATTYHGLLPCRDCAAVATTLTLRGEGYVLERRRLGRQSELTIERGEAKLRYSGALRLYPEDGSVPAWLELDGDDGSARVLALDGHGYRDDTTGAYVLREAPPVRLRPDERELFVDSERVACRDADDDLATCLRVVDAGAPGSTTSTSWSALPVSIAGFDPVPGQLYHVIVRGEAPAIELARVVAEQADRRPRGGELFVLQGGRASDERAVGTPSLRFDVVGARVAGHDGCNPFQARLSAMGARELEIGPTAGPRAACPDSSAAMAFRELLTRAAEYRLYPAAGELELLDHRGTALAAFARRATPPLTQ